MTTRYKTQAFIFGKNDVNEFDRIFSVFTDEFGRLDIFAKAIRKGVSKLRSGIDTFYFSEIEFIQGKRRKTLTDAVIIEKLKNIGKNPLKFKIGHNIGEILSSFIIGEERDKDIFKLLKETFDRLDKENLTDRQCARLEYYFLWNIISLLGYRPEVEKCSVCNNKLNPESIYFSNKSGGAVCKKCLSDDLKVLIIN